MLGFSKKRPPPPAKPPAAKTPPATRSRAWLGVGRAMRRMFDSAKSDRLTTGWGTSPIPADDVVRRNLTVLVARSRDLAANNDYARQFLRKVGQNIVGHRGVQLQAQARDTSGKLDQVANDAIEAAFREWARAENCDVTGTQSWRAIQRSCAQSAAKDGEFMVRFVTGADAGPWGFSLQLLDPIRCPVDFDEAARPNGKFIRHGIEFNRFGRPLAYYFSATDAENADYVTGGRRFIRVPADEIVHGFVSDMVGQKRGLPWMATGLRRAKMLSGLEEAALVNLRVSSAKGGFFEWAEGHGPRIDEDNEEPVMMDAEPGVFQELPPGVTFREFNPVYPTGELMPFHKIILRGMASGWGVSYNDTANDLEGVNFSSIRQGKLDERDNWRDMQEWFIEQLIEPVFAQWLPRALLAGRITVNGKPLPAHKMEKFRDVSWQGRRWEWIDPRADQQSASDSVKSLQNSASRVMRSQGRDPRTVWREIASDIEEMRAAGIPDEFIMLAMGRTAKTGGNPSEQPDPEKPE